jgi:hypothetical protein
MKYYYLEGIEKKGPYSLEEVKSRSLSKETMIYREDKDSWFPLSSFDELNLVDVIKLAPIIDLAQKNTSKDKKIKIPKYGILIVLLAISLVLSYLITLIQQQNDYNKISEEINEVFKGKKSISDYSIDDRAVEDGKLYNVVYHPTNDTFLNNNKYANPIDSLIKNLSDKESGASIGQNAYLEANGITLFSQPYNYESDKDENIYEKELKQWNLFKNLNQYFIKYKYIDGFTALNLWRSNDVFTITTYCGGDMAYKVPAKIYKPGTNYGYFKTPGYTISTFRPSINTCYEEAAKFLTVEDKDSTYVPNSFYKILDFELGGFKSDFYEVTPFGDKYVRWNDTIYVKRPSGERSFVIDEDKITSSTSRDDGYVFSTSWIVWYKRYSNRYTLETKKWSFLKYFSVYSLIFIVISIIFYFVYKNRNRIVLE